MIRAAVLLATGVLAHLALAPAPARAGEAAVRIETGAGVDTNPLRIAGDDRDPDPFVSLVAAGSLVSGDDRLSMRAGLSIGARTYPASLDASLVATRLDLAGGWAPARRFRLEASLAGRDLTDGAPAIEPDDLEAGGSRSESGGRAALEATIRAGSTRVGLLAALEGTAPRAGDLRDWTWYGPAAGLSVTTPAGDSQAVRAALEVAYREYPRWPVARADRLLVASVEWLRRRPVLLGIGYAFTLDRSGVTGGDYFRHRLTARAAVTLPGDATLALQGSLQRSHYPDGFYTDQPVLLTQSDTAQNALELRLSRPIGSRLELALTAAVYGSEQSDGGVERVPFGREVIGLSVAWRAPETAKVPPPPPPRG